MSAPVDPKLAQRAGEAAMRHNRVREALLRIPASQRAAAARQIAAAIDQRLKRGGR